MQSMTGRLIWTILVGSVWESSLINNIYEQLSGPTAWSVWLTCWHAWWHSSSYLFCPAGYWSVVGGALSFYQSNSQTVNSDSSLRIFLRWKVKAQWEHRWSSQKWEMLANFEFEDRRSGSISSGPSLHRIINQALVDFWISLEAPIFTAYPLARVKDFTLKVPTIFLLTFESWCATMQLQTDVLPGAGTPSFLPRLISGHFDFPAGKYHPPPGQGRDLGASAEKLQKKRKREEAVALCIFNHVAILKEISITTLVVFEFLFSSPCQT